MAVSNVIKRTLPVPLTDEQVLHRSKQKCVLEKEVDQKLKDVEIAVEQAKAAKKKVEKDLKQAQDEILRLRRVVLTGYEDQEIECTEEADYERGVFVLRRNDTWAIFEERKMKAEDRQIPLFDQTNAANVVPIDKKARKKKKDEALEQAAQSSTEPSQQPSTEAPSTQPESAQGITITSFKSGDALIIALTHNDQVRHITAEEAEKKFISSKNPDVMEDYRSFDVLQEAGLKAVQELTTEALQSLFNELSESILYKSSEEEFSAPEPVVKAKEEAVKATSESQSSANSDQVEAPNFVLVAPIDRKPEGTWWRFIKDGEIIEVPSVTIYQLLGSNDLAVISATDIETKTRELINQASQVVLLGLWKEFLDLSFSKQTQEPDIERILNVIDGEEFVVLTIGDEERRIALHDLAVRFYGDRANNNKSREDAYGAAWRRIEAVWKQPDLRLLWNELAPKMDQAQPSTEPSQANIDAEMMRAAGYKLEPPQYKPAIKARKRPDGTAILVRQDGESLELSTMRVQLIERGWQVDDAIFIKGEVQKLSQDQLEVIWRNWASDANGQSKGQNTSSPKTNKKSPGKGKGKETSI